MSVYCNGNGNRTYRISLFDQEGNGMDAGKAMIGGIFQYGRSLEIPFYQRAYVWAQSF